MDIKRHLYCSVATIVLAGASFSASAAFIEFDQTAVPPTPGENVAYDGAGGPLIGTDIIFEEVAAGGAGVTQNSGVVLTCSPNCLLDFETGPNTAEGSENGGPGDQWTFAGGGTFTITGTLFDGGTQVATGTLVSGSFVGESAVTSGAPESLTFSGSGSDTKNADLLAFYGIDLEDFNFAQTAIALQVASFDGNGGFVSQVTDADFNNRANPTTVPEPQVLALFALGIVLLGLGAAKRRKNGMSNAR